MSTPTGFPPVLYDYWHATDGEISNAIADGKFEGVTVSSLLKTFLDMQLENPEGQDERAFPQSLKSTVLSKIIAELKSADDLPAITRHIARSLDNVTYRQLLADARLPYRILRAFLQIPHSDIPDCTLITGRTIINLEEVILANEAVLQQSKSSDRDHAHLVTLEDLRDVLALPDENGYDSFLRKNPPTGGLELFDVFRPRKIQVSSNDAVFRDFFNVRTTHILHGLDWTNVCVTGEILLDTLLRRRPRGATPIRLCLFGLNAIEADQKLEEIYNVWLGNLPLGVREKQVVKTAQSMYLFSCLTYPIEIELQLFDDKMDLLLQWEYDPYALCYNGENVYMLPRCARAIETGYTIFTTRLCWGENLVHCQTRVPALMCLAHRGFGLRILPSYMRCLVEGILETKHDTCARTVTIQKRESSSSQSHMKYGSLHKRSELGVNVAMLKHPSDSKTLKKYAVLGRRRLPTVLRDYQDIGLLVDEAPYQTFALESFSWLIDFAVDWESYFSTEASCELYGDRISDPVLNYQYSANLHDRFREYKNLAVNIDEYNEILFGDLQIMICHRLQIPFQMFGWTNYLTRCIRRNIHGPTLSNVQEGQITMPLIIPSDLERHIAECLDTHVSPSSHYLPNNSPIDDIHEPAIYNPRITRLPSILPTENERGNLKFWVISNQRMWVGPDKKLDAVSEILWCLVAWFSYGFNYGETHSLDTDSPACLLWTICYLRRKLGTLPGISSASDDDRRRQGLPIVKESLLFRTFVAGTLIPNLQKPEEPVNDDEWIQGDNGVYEPFSELSDYDYDSALEGFPDWTDPVELRP